MSSDYTSSTVAAGNSVRYYMSWMAKLIVDCSFNQLCKARCSTRAAMFTDVSPNDFNRVVFS